MPGPTPVAEIAVHVFGLTLSQWTAIGVMVTGLGVIVTGVGVIVSGIFTRRGLNQDRAIAENTAARSEAAARLTEEYTTRIVDALEKIASEGLGAGGARRGVRWELAHHDGDRYRLTNVGDSAAHDVKVETDESLPTTNFEGGPDVGPGEALSFMAITTFGTRDSTVTVRWREEGKDEDLVWRYPLPGRPPRR
jgi:hypothetical protein